MKLIFLLPCLFATYAQASSTVTLGIAQLRDSAGGVIEDGNGTVSDGSGSFFGGTWAIIVSAQPGDPPTAGSLPGGLSDGTSLTSSNKSAIIADFNGVTLTEGTNQGNFHIHSIGEFDSGASLGFNGGILQSFSFDLPGNPGAGFAENTLFGVYWFPGIAAGHTLTGSYEVGGFANSIANPASSGGAWGTTVGSDGPTLTSNFFETNFNQGTLEGADTGLGADRFTAVAVPEPSTFALSALGLAALLRRRRK